MSKRARGREEGEPGGQKRMEGSSRNDLNAAVITLFVGNCALIDENWVWNDYRATTILPSPCAIEHGCGRSKIHIETRYGNIIGNSLIPRLWRIPNHRSFQRTFLGFILALRVVYCAFFELCSREAVYRLSLIQDERRKHLLAGKRDLKQLVFGWNWYLKVASLTLFYALLIGAQNSRLFYFFYNLDFAWIWLMREYFNFNEQER